MVNLNSLMPFVVLMVQADFANAADVVTRADNLER